MNGESIHRLMYCYGDNSQYDFGSKFLVPEERKKVNSIYWVGKEVEISYSIQFHFEEKDGSINIYSPLVPKGWKVNIMPNYYKQSTNADKILLFTSFPYEKEDIYDVYEELKNNNLRPIIALYEKKRNFAASDYSNNNIENTLSLLSKKMVAEGKDNVIIHDLDIELLYHVLFFIKNDYLYSIEARLYSELINIGYSMESYDRKFDSKFEEYKDAFCLENIADNERLFIYGIDMKQIGVWQALSERYRKIFVEKDDGIKSKAIELFNDFFEGTDMTILIENNLSIQMDNEFKNYFYNNKTKLLVSTELQYMLLAEFRIEFKKIATDFINKGVRNCIKSELSRNINNIKTMMKG